MPTSSMSNRRLQAESTVEMAKEIGRLNAALLKEKRPYLLVGPAGGGVPTVARIPFSGTTYRRGSHHRAQKRLAQADPHRDPLLSEYHSLGIHYVTVTEGAEERWIGNGSDLFVRSRKLVS